VENQNIPPPNLHLPCITGASYCRNPLGSDRFSDCATRNTPGRTSPLQPTITPHRGLRTTPSEKLGIHNSYAHSHVQNIRPAENIHIAGSTTIRVTLDTALPPKLDLTTGFHPTPRRTQQHMCHIPVAIHHRT